MTGISKIDFDSIVVFIGYAFGERGMLKPGEWISNCTGDMMYDP